MSKAAAVKATMRGPSWAEILHLTKDICGLFVRHPFYVKVANCTDATVVMDGHTKGVPLCQKPAQPLLIHNGWTFCGRNSMPSL